MSICDDFVSYDAKDKYTQCNLTRGQSYQIVWIPACFAVEGNYIRIKNDKNEWDRWFVKSVYSTTNKENLSYVETARRNRQKTLK